MVTATNFSVTVDAGTRVIACGREVSGFAGRLIQDPTYPQYFSAGGQYKYPTGPGDPEGFLYLGTKQGDGTWTGGAQQSIIDAYVAAGGGRLYCIAVKNPGDEVAPGEGTAELTPFPSNDIANGLIEAQMVQWDGWFGQLEAAGVPVDLFIYDDHQGATPLAGGGDASPSVEQTFVQALVNRFEHRKNINFVIAEEYGEGFSVARISNIATAMRAANSEILIGNHQNSGVVFAHKTDSNVKAFKVQNNNRTRAQMYSDLTGIRADSVSNGYLIDVVEMGDTGLTGSAARLMDATIFMAGCAGSARYQQSAHTMPSSDLADCVRLSQFAESTTFYTMSPNDALKSNSNYDHLLANPGADYIAFAESLSGAVGIQSMTAGTYTAVWQACDADETATLTGVSVSSGTNTFSKPGSITSNEVFLWLSRQ